MRRDDYRAARYESVPEECSRRKELCWMLYMCEIVRTGKRSEETAKRGGERRSQIQESDTWPLLYLS